MRAINQRHSIEEEESVWGVRHRGIRAVERAEGKKRSEHLARSRAEVIGFLSVILRY